MVMVFRKLPVTDALSDLDETVSVNEDTVLNGGLLDNLADADSSDHTITGATVDTNGDGVSEAYRSNRRY